MAFHTAIAVSRHEEVSSNHAWVTVPFLEIVDGFPIEILKTKGGSVVIDYLFRTNFESPILDLLLSLNHTNNKCFNNVKSGLRVMVGALDDTWNIYEIVSTEKELRNVSTNVVQQIELATWVHVNVLFV